MPGTTKQTGSPTSPLRVILFVCAVLSVCIFALNLFHVKALFNPSDWLGRLSSEQRLISLGTWDVEIFQCSGGAAFSEAACSTLSGSYMFERVTVPFNRSVSSRMLEFTDRATHMRMRHGLSPEARSWIDARTREEYLRPDLIFFANRRCFASEAGQPYCGQRTEIYALDTVLKNSTVEVVMPLGGTSTFGPRVIPPLFVESNLMPRVIALDDKATAAFTTESILLVTIMVFFAALALLFPTCPSVVIMFFFCFFKVCQTSLGYIYENQVVDWVLSLLGSSGYIAVSIVINAGLLALLLYLTVAILRGSYELSKLEVGYGLGLVGLYVGIASIYGRMGELSVATLFARDAIATLFGAIWMMYYLLMEWQRDDSAEDHPGHTGNIHVSKLTALKTFTYLFFLVSYGAAGAQTALGTDAIPNLLPWQSLFFVPGLGLAVLMDLASSRNAASPAMTSGHHLAAGPSR